MASEKPKQTVDREFTVRNHDSDEDVPDDVHNRLLENIKQIHGQSKISPAVRNEPATDVSEFSFNSKRKSSSGKTVFREDDLIRAIKKKQPHVAQKLETARKGKTLPKPLETVHERKFQREVGFENLKTRLSRWNDVVHSNRAADQLSFPLKSRKIEVYDHTDCDLFATSGNPIPLEIEMNKILNVSDTAKEDKKKAEQSKFRLTLKELIEKRKTMAKMKAQASYKIAKAARQNKIKSKKYHRILRREKTRAQMKDFETLQKTDPEAALKQLEMLEKTRAEERATLRHRNTGKWARNQMVKAKYNKESRIALSEQLSQNRQLTQKRCDADSDSESIDSETEAASRNIGADSSNPWIADTNEYAQFVTNYKKFWEEKASENAIVSDETAITSPAETAASTSAAATATCDSAKSGNVPKLKSGVSKPGDVQACHNSKLEPAKKEVSESEPQSGDVSKETSAGGKKTKKMKKNRQGIAPKVVTGIVNSSGSWTVTAVTAEAPDVCAASSNVHISEMFESLDEKLQRKLKRKLNEVQNAVPTMTAGSTEKKKKKPKKARIVKERVTENAVPAPPVLAIGSELEKPSVNVGTTKSESQSNDNIDPNKYLKVASKTLITEIPDLMNVGDEGLDDVEEDEQLQHQMTISEAFAEDDVVAEFQEEKQKAEAEGQPKVVDLSLPGWGEWTDASLINRSETAGGRKTRRPRLNKRMLFRVPKAPPRKDANKGHVIINEEKSDKMKEHLVTDVPYPFTQVKDFEASIRAPIGRTWLPEMAHQQLIAPPVVTKLGTVIEPMDEGELITREDP